MDDQLFDQLANQVENELSSDPHEVKEDPSERQQQDWAAQEQGQGQVEAIPSDSGYQQQAEEAGFDPYDGLTDEQRSYFQSLQQQSEQAEQARRRASELDHQLRSNEGRIAAMQREFQSLKEREKEWSEQQRQLAESADAWRNSDAFKEFAKRWDEGEEWNGEQLATMMYGMMRDFQMKNQQTQTVSQQTGIDEATVRQMTQAEVQAHLARQEALNTLAQQHPDYEQIGSSQEYWNWVRSQDQDIQTWAQSSNPHSVSAILNMYKEDMATRQQGYASQDAQVPLSDQQASQYGTPLQQNGYAPQQFYGQQQPAPRQQAPYRQRQLAGAQALPAGVASYQTPPQNGAGGPYMTDSEYEQSLFQQAERELQQVN